VPARLLGLHGKPPAPASRSLGNEDTGKPTSSFGSARQQYANPDIAGAAS